MPSLTRKTLRDNRRALIGWTVGVAFMSMIYVSAYSSARDSQPPEGIGDALGMSDLTSAAGYLQGTVYGVFLPILLVMFAVMLGNRILTGPEESGELDLVLAHPITRRRLILDGFAALAVNVIVIGAVSLVMVMIAATSADMDIARGNLVATSLGLILLALTFGALAVATGALTGRRSAVFAVSGGVAAAAFLVNNLSTQVSALEPFIWVSPFHYYLGSDPLRAGFSLGYPLVLVAVIGALVAVAIASFERRDVAV